MKEKIETIKIKVLDRSSTTMKIFSPIGSPEEYLGHIMAVLSLIDRKGLPELLIKPVNEKKNAKTTLEALQQKPTGPREMLGRMGINRSNGGWTDYREEQCIHVAPARREESEWQGCIRAPRRT